MIELTAPYTLFDDVDLTIVERDDLDQHEAVIEQGLQTFVEVGTALLEIRDGRLYRQTHATFEEYCRERWGFTDRRARMLISAAEVVSNIKSGTTVPILPDSERSIRPLTHLDPDTQREAWTKAVDTAPNGKVTAAHVQRVVDGYKEQAEELADDEEFYDWGDDAPYEAAKAPVAQRPHVTNNSGNNEWYTPVDFVEAARLTLGCIDLDPASSHQANGVVRATTHYTIDDDGLAQAWRGNVWLNPPYADGLVEKFIDKLIDHYVASSVTEAVVLVNNATETKWFQSLAVHASAICFPSKRIRFNAPDGVKNSPLQGQAFLYLGAYPANFVENFSYFGLVVLVESVEVMVTA